MVVTLDDLEEALRSRWPLRLARNIGQAAALRAEYVRGRRDEAKECDYDHYDFDDGEQSEGCVLGLNCCCPHFFHDSSECYSAEDAQAYEDSLTDGRP